MTTRAAEFDQQIKEMRIQLEAQQRAPEMLEERVLERLRANLDAYDSSILEAVYAWREHEADDYPHTRRLIESLLPYTERRPMLAATLMSISGELSHQAGDIDAAIEAYMEAVDDLHEMHIDVDSKRIYSMMTLGHLLLLQGNRQGAETLFLDVLSYPWYQIREADLQALLRQYYIKAGLGLIDCRRGDLDSLREIYFVPAAEAELLPALRRAIKAAGGRLDR